MTSSCVVVATGSGLFVEEGEVICDWLGEGDEAGGGDEARFSTLAGGVDEVGACEAGRVDEPKDTGEPDATWVVDGVDIGATHLVQIVEVEVRITVETCVVICSVGVPLDVIVLVTGHEVRVVYTL